jgi:guanylate kinase
MSSSHSPFLVVFSSPSGAGKTSICREVVRRDRNVAYSVSATTRPRRKGETHGRSYWFHTEKRFKDLVRRNGLLEHAVVYDHYYGTPRARVMEQFRQGRDVIADLDIQGMRLCKQTLPGTVAIFINAPSRTTLARRLRRRGTDSDKVIARREAELKAELAAIPEFDYLVVNDRLESAVERVHAIIRAERLRTHRLRRGKGRTARHRRTAR